jgi:hypothetical protein
MPSPTVNKNVQIDFATAISAIKEGKKVTKAEWNDTRIYIAMIDGRLKITLPENSAMIDGRLKITLPENSFAAVDLIVTDGDLSGTDFIVLE